MHSVCPAVVGPATTEWVAKLSAWVLFLTPQDAGDRLHKKLPLGVRSDFHRPLLLLRMCFHQVFEKPWRTSLDFISADVIAAGSSPSGARRGPHLSRRECPFPGTSRVSLQP